MDLDPEDVLCSEFSDAFAHAADEIRNIFIERFKKTGLDLDVVVFQTLSRLLGEFEGRLLTTDASVRWISEMRACGIADGLESEIRFHREICQDEECNTMQRLVRARKRFDKMISQVDDKHRAADVLLGELLSHLRPATHQARS